MKQLHCRLSARLSLAAFALLLPISAHAQQDVASSGLGSVEPNSVAGTLLNFVPYGLMFFVVYFLLLRPANKQRREQQQMLAQIKKDDEVVTSSGIVGRIVSLEQDIVLLEVADKVRVRMLRDRIAGPYVAKAAANAVKGAPNAARGGA